MCCPELCFNTCQYMHHTIQYKPQYMPINILWAKTCVLSRSSIDICLVCIVVCIGMYFACIEMY